MAKPGRHPACIAYMLHELWQKIVDELKKRTATVIVGAVALLLLVMATWGRSKFDDYVEEVIVARMQSPSSRLHSNFETFATEMVSKTTRDAIGLWNSGNVVLTPSQSQHMFHLFIPDASDARLFLDVRWPYPPKQGEVIRVYLKGQSRPLATIKESSPRYELDLSTSLKKVLAQTEIEDADLTPDQGQLRHLYSIVMNLSGASDRSTGVTVRYMAIVQPTIHLQAVKAVAPPAG
jgi:hypothetical protein